MTVAANLYALANTLNQLTERDQFKAAMQKATTALARTPGLE